jgi:hypothetical protein
VLDFCDLFELFDEIEDNEEEEEDDDDEEEDKGDDDKELNELLELAWGATVSIKSFCLTIEFVGEFVMKLFKRGFGVDELELNDDGELLLVLVLLVGVKVAFDVCISKLDVVEFIELDDEDVVGGVTLAVHMSCIRSLSKGGANCGDCNDVWAPLLFSLFGLLPFIGEKRE